VKENKFFKKKEIDLTKISIFTLTTEGKSYLKAAIKKTIQIILMITCVLFVIYVAWALNEFYFSKKKQVCDELVSSFIWNKKEELKLIEIKKQNEYSKKTAPPQSERRVILDSTVYTVTTADKVLARRSIPECKEVYINGLEVR
jgi:hypothetical protein